MCLHLIVLPGDDWSLDATKVAGVGLRLLIWKSRTVLFWEGKKKTHLIWNTFLNILRLNITIKPEPAALRYIEIEMKCLPKTVISDKFGGLMDYIGSANQSTKTCDEIWIFVHIANQRI